MQNKLTRKAAITFISLTLAASPLAAVFAEGDAPEIPDEGVVNQIDDADAQPGETGQEGQDTDPQDPSEDPENPSGGEGQDPTSPTDPTDPTEPTDPSGPTDPSDPSDLTDPDTPEDPEPVVHVLDAVVTAHEYGAEPESGEPLSGIRITVTYADDSTEEITAEDGKIHLEISDEDKISEDSEYAWSFKGDEEYLPAEGTLKEEEENAVAISERYVASSEDFEFSESEDVSNGYFRKEGDYVLNAAEGKKLAESLDGEPKDTITVTVDTDGVISDFYVYAEDGTCSKVVTGETVSFDNEAPVIVSVTSEAAGSATYVKRHGIYAKEKAEIAITAEITEEGAGLEKVYLISKKDGQKPKFEPVEEDFENGRYIITIGLPDEETLLDADTVYLVAEDAFGNTSTETLIAKTEDGSSVTIEKLSPVINVTVTPDPNTNGWYNAAPTITAAAQDDMSGLSEFAVYQGKEILASQTFDHKEKEKQTVTATPELGAGQNDTYTFTVRASDNAGNEAEDTFTLKIDTEKPVLSYKGITDGKVYRKIPEIAINEEERHSSENGNVIKVSIEGPGLDKPHTVTEKGKSSLTIDPSIFVKDGTYTVTADAEDAAGNKADQISFSVTKDAAEPEITLSFDEEPNEYGWYRDIPTLVAEAEDKSAGIERIRLIAGDAELASKDIDPEEAGDLQVIRIRPASLPEGSNGTYAFSAEVTDKAGNKATKDISAKIDLDAPQISAKGLESGTFYQKSPHLTVTEDEEFHSEEGNRIEISVERDGKSLDTLVFRGTNTAEAGSEVFGEDGAYKVAVIATDAAGNESGVLSYEFTKDGTDPELTLENTGSPNEYGWYNKLPELISEAKDPTSGLSLHRISQNGKIIYSKKLSGVASHKATDKPDLTEPSKNGKYTFVAEAQDAAGNKIQEKLVLKIDLEAPVLSQDSIEKGKHYRKVPKITIDEKERYGSAEGASISYTVYRNGKTISSKTLKGGNGLTLPSKLFSKNGDYKVSVQAKDAAGNASKILRFNFTKDSKAPDVEITGVKNGQFYNRSQTVKITVKERNYETDKVSVSASRELGGSRNGINIPWKNTGKTSETSRTFSETGTYTVTASAVDKAGNSSGKKTVTFTIDTKAPEIEISGVKDGGIYTYGMGLSPGAKVTDDYLDTESISYTKAGVPVGRPSFEQVKENDGLYTMTVTARDKAGNTTTKTVTFTVNRFGSYFVYGDAVRNTMGMALQNIDEDLVITERNVSELSESENRIYRDGKTVESSAVTDRAGTEDGYYVYKHIFGKENFQEEGAYEINVISSDTDGNEMESKEENGQIRFFVDRTAPNLTVSGIDEKGNRGDHADLTIKADDLLTGVEKTAATVNGEPAPLKENEDGTYTLTVNEGMHQEIHVTSTDGAGNKADFEGSISVSDSPVKLWIDRLGKFVLGGAAGLGALAGGAFLIAGKRKKDEDEEDPKGKE